MKVLVIEWNKESAETIVNLLGTNGFFTIWRRDGTEAYLLCQLADMVLLNLNLPDVGGLDLLHRIRRASTVPVIAISDQGNELPVSRVLDAGADDYLVKPIWADALLAKIERMERHSRIPVDDVVRVMDVSISLHGRTVLVGHKQVDLTPKEFDVLAVLARRPGHAVHREQILRKVWGNVDFSGSRSLDVHMTALRSKLERPDLIHTIRGYGYRLASPFAANPDELSYGVVNEAGRTTATTRGARPLGMVGARNREPERLTTAGAAAADACDRRVRRAAGGLR